MRTKQNTGHYYEKCTKHLALYLAQRRSSKCFLFYELLLPLPTLASPSSHTSQLFQPNVYVSPISSVCFFFSLLLYPLSGPAHPLLWLQTVTVPMISETMSLTMCFPVSLLFLKPPGHLAGFPLGIPNPSILICGI